MISLDPRETAGKAVPELMMDNTRIRSEKQATILGVSIDSQLTFTSHCQNMAKKISKRTQVLSALAGKNWGIVANNLRSVYCSYVRPGGLYASEIWGPFLARTNINRLEVVNNRAAAIITGTPRGSPASAIKCEAMIQNIDLIIADGAAMQMVKYLELPEDHHLRKLAEREVTPRLKAKAENSFRPDWRRVTRNRVNELPQGMDPREAILRGKDAKNEERYQTETPPNSTHRQACNGEHLPRSVNRTRAEEMFLYRLRVNRETSLKDTKYRFRLSQNPICVHCDEEEPETTEHYLLKCTNWDRARKQHLGRNPTLTLLQTNHINIILFATSTGHFKSPDYQEGS